MSKASAILNLLKYAPMVLGIVKQFRDAGVKSQQVSDEFSEALQHAQDFQKQASQRLEALETENARLKTRIKEMASSFTIMKALLMTSGGVAVIALIIALIALVQLAAR